MKKSNKSTIKMNFKNSKLMTDYKFRFKFFTTISFVISVFYAIFNGFMALTSKTIWFAALSGYYFLLVFLRGGVLLNNSKRIRKMDMDSFYRMQVRKLKAYRITGIVLLGIIMMLSLAVMQMVESNKSYEYAGLAIYVAALYTFIKVIVAIVNICKAKKRKDISLEALRHINLADALVSLLSLQTAMFKAFSPEGKNDIANVVTGAVVCGMILLLGIFMIVKSSIAIKKLKENNG